MSQSITNKLIANVKQTTTSSNTHINRSSVICIDTSQNFLGINVINPEYSIQHQQLINTTLCLDSDQKQKSPTRQTKHPRTVLWWRTFNFIIILSNSSNFPEYVTSAAALGRRCWYSRERRLICDYPRRRQLRLSKRDLCLPSAT